MAKSNGSNGPALDLGHRHPEQGVHPARHSTSVEALGIDTGALPDSAEMSVNLLELQRGRDRWDAATVVGFQNREFFSVMFRFRLYALAEMFSHWEARVWIRRFASFDDMRLRVYFSRGNSAQKGNAAFDGWAAQPKFGGDLPISLQQDVGAAWADLCSQEITEQERRAFWPGAIWSLDGRSATIAAPKVLRSIRVVELSKCAEQLS